MKGLEASSWSQKQCTKILRTLYTTGMCENSTMASSNYWPDWTNHQTEVVSMCETIQEQDSISVLWKDFTIVGISRYFKVFARLSDDQEFESRH